MPSAEERWWAESAYLGYIAGVAVLRHPESERAQEIHGFEEITPENHEDIILSAEKLMVRSLRDVIRFAHPPDERSRLLTMENRFNSALPHMIRTVEGVYNKNSQELYALDPSLWFVHLGPMTDPKIYRSLIHPHLERLRTIRLLDGLNASARFEPILRNRRLQNLRIAA